MLRLFVLPLERAGRELWKIVKIIVGTLNVTDARCFGKARKLKYGFRHKQKALLTLDESLREGPPIPDLEDVLPLPTSFATGAQRLASYLDFTILY